MKNILFLGLVILVASCDGNKGGGDNSGSDTSPIKDENVSNCSVSFSKRDTVEVIAKKANQARVECNLSEEETLLLFKK